MKTKFIALLGRANKKTIIVGSIVVILILTLGLGVLAASWKIKRMSSFVSSVVATKSERIMGQGKSAHCSSYTPDSDNKFIPPQDAAETGELAIIVTDLDGAKNSIANVAAKNGGDIYTTEISYLSGNTKNGTIVIQIPVSSFDSTFVDLKKIGSQVVQESTKKIPTWDYNVYPLAASITGAENVPASAESSASVTGSSVSDGAVASADQPTGSTVASISPSIAMMPIYKQISQDKGYVKVVFADYGTSGHSDKNITRSDIANVIDTGYFGQNMRNNIWIVMAVKSIMLITLIAILFVITKKIIRNLRKLKKNRPTVHVVKQAAKTRVKAVRVRKRL